MLNEIIKRLQYIDFLIREHKAGNAEKLAKVTGVSVRTIYKYLGLMKRFGAPIAFNDLSKTYYYETEGNLECTFGFKVSNQDQQAGPDMANLSLVSMQEFLQQLNREIINYN